MMELQHALTLKLKKQQRPATSQKKKKSSGASEKLTKECQELLAGTVAEDVATQLAS